MTKIAPNPELMISLFHALLVEQKRIVIKKEWLDRFKGHLNEVDVKVEIEGNGNLLVTLQGFRQVPQEA